jgi:biotin carboxyl carrier protein
MSLMERFEELGLDELVLNVDGTKVELTSSGRPPIVESDDDAATGLHPVLAPSVGIVRQLAAVDGEVVADDVVCLLEVWTSTIPVQAGTAGTVRERHVEEGALAEYGQALVSIEPA